MSVKKRQAFTLVEMLVVVTIMAILMALAVPAVSGILRSNRWSSSQNLIRSALAMAQSHAIKSQRYAGIRFQQDNEGRQYLVLIENRPVMDFGGTIDTVAARFTSVENVKPAVLPNGMGALSLSVTSSATPDDDLDDSADPYSLAGQTTFSIVFSPTGQLITKDVIVDERNDTDTTFGAPSVVDADPREGPNLYYDDMFWLGSREAGPTWARQELSTTGLFLYDQDLMQQVDTGLRWTDYVSDYPSGEGISRVIINAYTGGIIEGLD